MKLTELMVGDWVICNDLKKQVAAIGETVGFLDCNNQVYWAYEGFDRIDPIPLTEDILVKNGFQKSNDKTFLLKNQIEIEVGPKFSEVSAIYTDYDRTFDKYGRCYIEIAIIHYVHQLQHLLRLCGIEKEIEL